MDPLSITAGIAGLITLADIIIERTYNYIRYCKDAATDALRLLTEVQGLLGVLRSLQILELQVSKNALQTVIPASQQYECKTLLQEILDKLADAIPQAAARRIHMYQRVLKWKWTAESIETCLVRIGRHKQAFNLAVSMQSLEAVFQNTSEQRDAAKDIADIRVILLRIEMTKERRELLELFGTFDSHSNHAMSVQLRHPGTGLWLLASPELKTWKQKKNSKLWMYGIPGAGKTILAGMVVEEALRSASPLVGVVFYYCDYKNGKSREEKNVLASIAGQLAMQSTSCADMLLEKRSAENGPTLPSVQVLSKLVRRMSSRFDEVVIVVDAVDEAKDPGDVTRALCELAKPGESSSNIKLAILSRDEPFIRECMPQPDFQHLPIAARNRDLQLFVAAQIDERIRTRKLRINSPTLKDDVLDLLVKRAHGM
jgi:Cdc6-like AAA superfamily ATPase